MPKTDVLTDLLQRGVQEIIVHEEFEKKLRSGRKIRIKHGVDPTTTDLHLGYSVIYRKLRKFQELGHTVIFLIGSFTARFGDPTDKGTTRQMRTKAEVEKTAKSYVTQVGKILDVKKLEIVYNGDWFDTMSAEELLHLMSEFTVARMLERDMFEERMKSGQDIGLHEPVYPVLQGYDSVMIRSDATVIGNDQKFNELQARKIQQLHSQEPQDIVIMPLLIGTDGKRKMSQSLRNYIGLDESPSEQYGKIMSIPDPLLFQYFELCTDVSLDEIQTMKLALQEGENPKDLKMRLGREIVKLYHGEKASQEAEAKFVKIFQKRETPSEIPEKTLSKKSMDVCELLFETGLAKSKSEARRLIEGGGVKVDDIRIEDPKKMLSLSHKFVVLKVGKRHFMKVRAL